VHADCIDALERRVCEVQGDRTGLRSGVSEVVGIPCACRSGQTHDPQGVEPVVVDKRSVTGSFRLGLGGCSARGHHHSDLLAPSAPVVELRLGPHLVGSTLVVELVDSREAVTRDLVASARLLEVPRNHSHDVFGLGDLVGHSLVGLSVLECLREGREQALHDFHDDFTCLAPGREEKFVLPHLLSSREADALPAAGADCTSRRGIIPLVGGAVHCLLHLDPDAVTGLEDETHGGGLEGLPAHVELRGGGGRGAPRLLPATDELCDDGLVIARWTRVVHPEDGLDLGTQMIMEPPEEDEDRIVVIIQMLEEPSTVPADDVLTPAGDRDGADHLRVAQNGADAVHEGHVCTRGLDPLEELDEDAHGVVSPNTHGLEVLEFVRDRELVGDHADPLDFTRAFDLLAEEMTLFNLVGLALFVDDGHTPELVRSQEPVQFLDDPFSGSGLV